MVQKMTKMCKINEIIKSTQEDIIIGEFAGRDSVAAILKALESESVRTILPVASFSPTEYGNFESLEHNYMHMLERVERLYGNEKTILPLLYHSNPDLWSVINGRYVDFLNKKFGFYTPCIGCHAYLHLLRIPLSLKLGKKIISGERESHDGRIKVNQTAESLDTYKRIAEYFGSEILMPIRYINDGNEVEELIGWEWDEGKGHQSCVFSGNYSCPNGTVDYMKKNTIEYLEKFLYPSCIALGELIIEDEDATREKMIRTLKDRGVIL